MLTLMIGIRLPTSIGGTAQTEKVEMQPLFISLATTEAMVSFVQRLKRIIHLLYQHNTFS
jgi:hypothetical protein